MVIVGAGVAPISHDTAIYRLSVTRCLLSGCLDDVRILGNLQVPGLGCLSLHGYFPYRIFPFAEIVIAVFICTCEVCRQVSVDISSDLSFRIEKGRIVLLSLLMVRCLCYFGDRNACVHPAGKGIRSNSLPYHCRICAFCFRLLCLGHNSCGRKGPLRPIHGPHNVQIPIQNLPCGIAACRDLSIVKEYQFRALCRISVLIQVIYVVIKGCVLAVYCIFRSVPLRPGHRYVGLRREEKISGSLADIIPFSSVSKQAVRNPDLYRVGLQADIRMENHLIFDIGVILNRLLFGIVGVHIIGVKFPAVRSSIRFFRQGIFLIRIVRCIALVPGRRATHHAEERCRRSFPHGCADFGFRQSFQFFYRHQVAEVFLGIGRLLLVRIRGSRCCRALVRVRRSCH